ncbi:MULTISPECIES: cell division protein FtsZ [Kangiella]|jgi:cell division protein FtsZ|uniref:Cell division protein FtsZ n=2 Tax=Kangiella TaxID=261963 RepID=A0A318D236_9GAMM|nr:cell division protein FtsZ [Rickettsiales bacterium]PXF63296.1 cell division protein FtsZ [Kangiella spongicola]
MPNMFELVDNCQNSAVIKVIGVGGGGGNAVEHMVRANIDGVEFICANTDAQALESSTAKTTLQIGQNITRGLGAGANPDVGRQAALEDRERIMESLQGSDMVFITAGMGGGTGTGAAPVIAEIAKEMGILTVAVVTKPFKFERKKRMKLAEAGIDELRNAVDSLIIIPNDKLVAQFAGLRLTEAFASANSVLHGAVQGIAELITCPGLINVDFADVRTVMAEQGQAMMGTGIASGEGRAQVAADMAVASPLLEDVDLSGARGILVNVTANEEFTIDEFSEVCEVIEDIAHEDAIVVVGTAIDDSMGDEMRVTVVATGLGQEAGMRLVSDNKEQQVRKPSGELDFNKLDVPPAARKQAGVDDSETAQKMAVGSDVDNFLDIPAFLRKQAD